MTSEITEDTSLSGLEIRKLLSLDDTEHKRLYKLVNTRVEKEDLVVLDYKIQANRMRLVSIVRKIWNRARSKAQTPENLTQLLFTFALRRVRNARKRLQRTHSMSATSFILLDTMLISWFSSQH